MTDLPDSWDHPPDYTRFHRDQAQWNFRFIHNLANNLAYQDAVKDIQKVFQPAEEKFLQIQPSLEKQAVELFHRNSTRGSEMFVTEYSRRCLTQVGDAYNELVDYLMFRYLLGYSDVAPPELPSIAAPVIPDMQTVSPN